MDLGTKISPRSGRVLQSAHEMWNCLIPPTKVVGEQPKYWETMATTNVEKDAQKRDENVEINRLESPFKVIFDTFY